jgi:hypothetical protein
MTLMQVAYNNKEEFTAFSAWRYRPMNLPHKSMLKLRLFRKKELYSAPIDVSVITLPLT